VLRQERAREHRTALRSPRRPITATPLLRPVLDRKAGIEAAHLRLQHGAAYFKAARRANTSRAECRIRSTQPRRALELSRAPQAQDKAPRQEGSKIASRAARNKRKQPAFANDKCDAHRACRCGGIAERDERLAVFVLQNNSTAEKRARGGGRSQGKQRSAVPPASQACQGGPRGNAPPRYVNHTHSTLAHKLGKQRRQPQCACAGQTKQPQARAPPPSSEGRAAAAAPAPRAAVNGTGGSDLSKRLAQLPVGSWSFRSLTKALGKNSAKGHSPVIFVLVVSKGCRPGVGITPGSR